MEYSTLANKKTLEELLEDSNRLSFKAGRFDAHNTWIVELIKAGHLDLVEELAIKIHLELKL